MTKLISAHKHDYICKIHPWYVFGSSWNPKAYNHSIILSRDDTDLISIKLDSSLPGRCFSELQSVFFDLVIPYQDCKNRSDSKLSTSSGPQPWNLWKRIPWIAPMVLMAKTNFKESMKPWNFIMSSTKVLSLDSCDSISWGIDSGAFPSWQLGIFISIRVGLEMRGWKEIQWFHFLSHSEYGFFIRFWRSSVGLSATMHLNVS